MYPAGPALLWNGPCRRATALQLARLLISGEVTDGGKVTVDVTDGELSLTPA